MIIMAQSAANSRNTHTHVDRSHSLTYLHQHSYNHVVRSTSPAITEFGIEFVYTTVRQVTQTSAIHAQVYVNTSPADHAYFSCPYTNEYIRQSGKSHKHYNNNISNNTSISHPLSSKDSPADHAYFRRPCTNKYVFNNNNEKL